MTEAEPMTHTNGLVIHWAARYDVLAWLLTRGRERDLRERFLELAHLQPGESVLDVGCGTGTLAIAAARRAGPSGSVEGIDASPEMVARARWKAAKTDVKASFLVGVVERLPFADRRFDLVLSTLMLHHLPKATRQECAREISRVLKPGGRVLGVDFDRAAGRGLLAHFHRHGHVAPADIVVLFEDAGLNVVARGPVGMNDLHFVLAEAPSQ
jgi:ubiquinone/menaquinone biosynthesis C-methylase UbiE